MNTRAKIEQVLDFANATLYPVTYGAAGDYAGIHALDVGKLLGDPSQRASWIVEKSTQLPSKNAGYTEADYPPRLRARGFLTIDNKEKLVSVMTRWEKSGRT